MSAAHKGKPLPPEQREKMIAGIRRRLDIPENRAQLKAQLRGAQTEEEKRRHREGLQASWRDPAVREARLKGMHASEPRRAQAASETMKRRYDNPEERKRQSERMKAAVTEDGRQKKVDATRRAWNDPDKRAQRIASIKQAQATPEYHEKAHQRNLQRHGFIYTLQSPDGREFITDDFVVFCAKHNLIYRSMQLVVRGERRSHKGWTGTRKKKTVTR
jgi:hypothetical protein